MREALKNDKNFAKKYSCKYPFNLLKIHLRQSFHTQVLQLLHSKRMKNIVDLIKLFVLICLQYKPNQEYKFYIAYKKYKRIQKSHRIIFIS